MRLQIGVNIFVKRIKLWVFDIHDRRLDHGLETGNVDLRARRQKRCRAQCCGRQKGFGQAGSWQQRSLSPGGHKAALLTGLVRLQLRKIALSQLWTNVPVRGFREELSPSCEVLVAKKRPVETGQVGLVISQGRG